MNNWDMLCSIQNIALALSCYPALPFNKEVELALCILRSAYAKIPDAEIWTGNPEDPLRGYRPTCYDLEMPTRED